MKGYWCNGLRKWKVTSAMDICVTMTLPMNVGMEIMMDNASLYITTFMCIIKMLHNSKLPVQWTSKMKVAIYSDTDIMMDNTLLSITDFKGTIKCYNLKLLVQFTFN